MSDLIEAINRLANELTEAPAAVIPLQRRIRNSSDAISAILAQGYPVKALAEALAERGVVTRAGQPISYGHLRVLLARLTPMHSASRRGTAILGARPIGQLAIQPPPRQAPRQRPDFSGGLFGNLFTQQDRPRD
jgi:hypothetical protein